MRTRSPTSSTRLVRTLLAPWLGVCAAVAVGVAAAAPDVPLGGAAWAEIGTPMRIIEAARDSAQTANQQDRQRRQGTGGAVDLVPDWLPGRLGELQLTGSGLERNEVQALDFFAQAAALGDARAAAHHAALVLSARVLNHDHDEAALNALQAAAKAGDTLAMVVLGRALVKGRAVDRDLGQAATIFRTAAQRGDSVAQVAWARAQLFGLGTGVDAGSAMATLAKAAAAGDEEARLLRAMGQLRGVGLPQDQARARSDMQMAAHLGLDLAQYSAGELLLGGIGGPVDREMAAHWFALAAAQGHEPSVKRLAELRGN